jgi:Protein of unknown function (DUF2975)
MTMPDERSTHLAGLSRFMAGCSTCGALAFPLLIVVTFMFPDRTQWLMFDINHLGAALNANIPMPYRLGAMACALVPAAFTVWALWSLRLLFLSYAHGEVFSRGALRHLTHVAVALFGGVVVGFAMQAPISLLLTWPLGHGHREISLAFGSDDVARLFMSGVMLVIARVMAEAGRLADENAKFV